jgi:hypothetical protein
MNEPEFRIKNSESEIILDPYLYGDEFGYGRNHFRQRTQMSGICECIQMRIPACMYVDHFTDYGIREYIYKNKVDSLNLLSRHRYFKNETHIIRQIPNNVKIFHFGKDVIEYGFDLYLEAKHRVFDLDYDLNIKYINHKIEPHYAFIFTFIKQLEK